MLIKAKNSRDKNMEINVNLILAKLLTQKKNVGDPPTHMQVHDPRAMRYHYRISLGFNLIFEVFQNKSRHWSCLSLHTLNSTTFPYTSSSEIQCTHPQTQ